MNALRSDGRFRPINVASAAGRGAVAFVAALTLLLIASPAYAHVQVKPFVAAPLDPTQWTVLVPNERDSSTVKVELQVPQGMLPFSYGDTPGWTRTLNLADDQSVESIVWEGRLEQDGFVEFVFLATTPEQEGQIEWKSLQTYEDGTVVEWIGDADSEEPAAITTIDADAPRQGAGGEGGAPEENPEPEPESGEGEGEEEEEEPEAEDDGAAPPEAAAPEVEDEGTSTLAVVALIASLVALGLAVVAFLGSRRSGGKAT